MRTLLINLPWREDKCLGVRAGSRWPFKSLPEADGKIHYIPFPFFLAYSTSLLKKNNQDARLIDAIAEEINNEECIAKIKEYNPRLIVAETSTPSFYNDIRILKEIHEFLPLAKIAVCGPHVSTFIKDTLDKYEFIDYVLFGEYELTLLELVNYLEKGVILDSIKGLAYRYNGKVTVNSTRAAIDNLNILPWPERNDVPIYKYNDGFCNLPTPNVQMWTSRGCSYTCTFCLWPQVIYREHRHRKREVKNVIDEMEYLINKYNFKAVYFDDDVFNIDRNYTLSICKEIMNRNMRIPWACMARADLMDEELLGFMRKAGLYAVKYGIESADEEILSCCKKNMGLDKAKYIINYTKKIGIKTHLTFCIGLPGETKMHIEKTINFIKDMNPDSYQVSFATPFPGTELYNYLKENRMLVSDNWSDYDGNYKCIVKTKELSDNDLAKAKLNFISVYRNTE